MDNKDHFQKGDILRQRDVPSQWLLLDGVSGPSKYGLGGSFTYIKRDGTRDQRFDVGYSGSLDTKQYEHVPVAELRKKSRGDLRQRLRTGEFTPHIPEIQGDQST